MGVDRTAEFFSTVEDLRRQSPAPAPGANSNSSPPSSSSSSSSSSSPTPAPLPLAPRKPNGAGGAGGGGGPKFTASSFAQAAAHISRGIYDTTSKLEKLTKLAKKRSLFEDNSGEINQVSSGIKHNIQTINNELTVLHDFVMETRNKTTGQSLDNSSAIVSDLKLQLANTTKSFANVLQLRTKTLKEQNSRRQTFETTSHSLPQRRQASNRTFGFEEEGKAVEDGDEVTTQQQALVHEDQSNRYLQDRAQAVEGIESTIGELATMYQKLVTIVDMQREMTIRIDESVDTALVNVEAGHGELIKHFDRLSSNQWLILKVFAILIAFAMFFVVVVA